MRNILAIIIMTFATQASGQYRPIFDRCEEAIDTNDKNSALEYTKKIESLENITVQQVKRAIPCFNFAYEEEYIYFWRIKEFMTSEQKKEYLEQEAKNLKRLEEAKTKFKAVDEEFDKISLKATCDQRKLDQITEEIVEIYSITEQKNNLLIEEKTKIACNNLNEKDPDAAILHPVCRQLFQTTTHPELNVGKELSGFMDEVATLVTESNEARRILYETRTQLDSLKKKRDELQLVIDSGGQELSKIVEQLISTNKIPDCEY